ncbi:cupin domain-containing protein [bacterium]|nr:cupin domain-containing protein [bacterium]
MNATYVRGVLLVLPFCFWSCLTSTSAVKLHLEDQQIDLQKYLRSHPLQARQNIRIDLIARGPTTSVHMVQIRKAEKPHIHAGHDLRVVLVRGRGTMVIDRKRIQAGVGSVFEIERGTPHHFINEGPTPAAGLVTFSPPYDGTDMIPVPAD